MASSCQDIGRHQWRPYYRMLLLYHERISSRYKKWLSGAGSTITGAHRGMNGQQSEGSGPD